MTVRGSISTRLCVAVYPLDYIHKVINDAVRDHLREGEFAHTLNAGHALLSQNAPAVRADTDDHSSPINLKEQKVRMDACAYMYTACHIYMGIF